MTAVINELVLRENDDVHDEVVHGDLLDGQLIGEDATKQIGQVTTVEKKHRCHE
jgi:hypothetical protein